MMATLTHARPSAQDKQKLKQVWKHIDANSCPYFYNFHMHTTCSDGKLNPQELIAQALQIGLLGLAITDHHSVKGYFAAQNWLDNNPSFLSPHLWTGVEITANLLGADIHILGYGFDPHHWALAKFLQGITIKGEEANADRVIKAIHQAGGLAVLAHPARYRVSGEILIPSAATLGIDAVEAYYCYNNPPIWKPSPQETQRVKELAEEYNLSLTCGTDTHGLNLLKRI
jgi:hypothetical protein